MRELLPNLDFELVAHVVSLLGSGAAVASTLYFWLVRVNREQPNLDILPLKSVQGSLMLPQENPAAYRALQPTDEQSIASYWLDLAVINNSILPNAVLGIDAWVRLKSGDWREARAKFTGDQSLPINVSPQTTCGLTLELSVALNAELSGTTNQDREDRAIEGLSAGMPIAVRLKGVNSTTFEFNLLGRPDEVSKTEPAVESAPVMKNAA